MDGDSLQGIITVTDMRAVLIEILGQKAGAAAL
jgi:hypothetical protein